MFHNEMYKYHWKTKFEIKFIKDVQKEAEKAMKIPNWT